MSKQDNRLLSAEEIKKLWGYPDSGKRIAQAQLAKCDAEKEKREHGYSVCGMCGGKMSRNPHPNAGKPNTEPNYVEIGAVFECIPCTHNTLHKWAGRATKAEGLVSDKDKEIAELKAQYFKELEEVRQVGVRLLDAQQVEYHAKLKGIENILLDANLTMGRKLMQITDIIVALKATILDK